MVVILLGTIISVEVSTKPGHVQNRVVQMAVVRVLTPIFEAEFLPCSHGFRQGYSTRTAIALVEEYRKQGYRWVEDVDFKSYFDTLDHAVLMAKAKTRVTDGRILGLIRSWLTAGVMSDGNLTYQTTGTPQGGRDLPPAGEHLPP